MQKKMFFFLIALKLPLPIKHTCKSDSVCVCYTQDLDFESWFVTLCCVLRKKINSHSIKSLTQVYNRYWEVGDINLTNIISMTKKSR